MTSPTVTLFFAAAPFSTTSVTMAPYGKKRFRSLASSGVTVTSFAPRSPLAPADDAALCCAAADQQRTAWSRDATKPTAAKLVAAHAIPRRSIVPPYDR